MSLMRLTYQNYKPGTYDNYLCTLSGLYTPFVYIYARFCHLSMNRTRKRMQQTYIFKTKMEIDNLKIQKAHVNFGLFLSFIFA